jgi:flagellar motor switch/type III secretory pathway protein FliN
MTPDETPEGATPEAAPETAPPAGASAEPETAAVASAPPESTPREGASAEAVEAPPPEAVPASPPPDGASAEAAAPDHASEAPEPVSDANDVGDHSATSIADALGADFFDDLEATLAEIPMRVGAELGRATLPLAQAVDLGPGVVIELDRGADDPIDLCINGQRFATGQLLLIEENEWAIRIEQIFPVDPAAGYASRQGGFTA